MLTMKYYLIQADLFVSIDVILYMCNVLKNINIYKRYGFDKYAPFANLKAFKI